MKKSVLLLLLAFSIALYGTNHVTYTPDEQTIFPNPERGFTNELGGETKLSDSKNHVVQGEEWAFEENENNTLVVLMYYLYNFKSKDISEKVLKGFDEDMQLLRDYGFKCVLRFAYDWGSKKDASLSWVQRHIEQLKPYWEKNADVIYAFEAGFVGRWGEWYYSSNFGNETQHLNTNRRAVIDALLAAVPEDKFILVRYPLIKTEYFGDENPLTAEQAFSGSHRSRIGHHNDAFLNTYGNEGTYSRDDDDLPEDDPVLRQYIADETLYVPNGGETNVEKESLASQVYTEAPAEMSRYHWSFCGSEYAEQVTDKWRSSGIFDELNRKMGYRFELVSADLPEVAYQGDQKTVQIAIRNVGYAPIYNARPVVLVLRNAQETYSIRLKTDPRRWLPNGEVSTINESVTIPAELPAGTYQLYLHMPDAYASLAADPRYAVRFANVGTWDETTGMNSLRATIEIQKNEGQGMSGAEAMDGKWTKELRNGQLIIRRGEHMMTIMGERL